MVYTLRIMGGMSHFKSYQPLKLAWEVVFLAYIKPNP